MNKLRKHLPGTLLVLGAALQLPAQTPAHELGIAFEMTAVYSRTTAGNPAIAGYYRHRLAGRHWLQVAYRRVRDIEFDHEAGYGCLLDSHWGSIQYAHRINVWRFIDFEPVAGLELRAGRESYVDRLVYPPAVAAMISNGTQPFFDLGVAGGVRVRVRLGHFFIAGEAVGGTFYADRAHWFIRRQVGIGLAF